MIVFSVSGPWYCQSAVWSGRWGQGDGVWVSILLDRFTPLLSVLSFWVFKR